MTSGNAFYKITPGSTGTLTVNPDFSDSPLDMRQVNTTRFALFQPETRDFFLQDAAAFEFGGRGFLRSDNIGRDNGRPFFSRNIGLANGRPVSIITGGKLSGEYGSIGIGALSVLTNGTGTGTEKPGLIGHARHRARVRANPKPASSSPTAIRRAQQATRSRAPISSFAIRTSFRARSCMADFYYQRSFSDTRGDDESAASSLTYPNEPCGGERNFKQIGTELFPALGFVNRTGIRVYDGTFQRRDRNSFGLRFIDVSHDWNFVTDLYNHLESRENIVAIAVSTPSQTNSRSRVSRSSKTCRTVHDRRQGAGAPGRYHWTNIAGLTSGPPTAGPMSARVDVMCCSFYNGNYLRASIPARSAADPLPAVPSRATPTRSICRPGSVDIHLFTLADVIVNFTPDMQLFTQSSTTTSARTSRSRCAIAGNTGPARNCSFRSARPR